jgi:hypothetical protein
MSYTTIFLFLCCVICRSNAALIIHGETTIAGTYETAQIFFDGLNSDMGIIDGELIFFQSDLTDVREKIVIATLVIPPESFVRNIQSRGAKALIMTGYPGTPGYIMLSTDNDDTSDIVMPMAELPKETWDLIGEKVRQEAFNVTLTGEEGNKWLSISRSPIIISFQVVSGAFTLVCIALAIEKLVAFNRYQQPSKVIVVNMCLILEIIGCALRLVAIADPQGINRVFPRVANTMLLLLHFPFALIPAILLTFFWLEALSNQKVIVTKPIEKMKVPLIVLCVFLILLELLTAGLRASSLGIQYEMNMTIIVVYAVVSLALLIFYTTVAIKVLIRIHNSESRKLRLRTIMTRILATAVALLLFIIAMVASIQMILVPLTFAIYIFLFFMFINLIVLCTILTFMPRTGKESTAGPASTGSSTTMTQVKT